jgi:hypothetical protein
MAAAEACGLRVDQIRQITNPQWYLYQWLHCLTLPPQGVPSPFWSEATNWPIGRRVIRKGLSALDKIGVNNVIAMVLDGLSGGDNLVAVLRKDRE